MPGENNHQSNYDTVLAAALATRLTADPRFMDQLSDCVRTLRLLFDFDALQILSNCTEDGHHLQLWSEGYDSDCMRALSQDFPKLYPPGFTARVSPELLLPPTISQQGDDLQPPFRNTSIYQQALHRQGFRDGMTLELWHQGRPTGLAHFSSKAACTYGIEQRKLARVARGIIEAALGRSPLAFHLPESFTLRFSDSVCMSSSRLITPNACNKLCQVMEHIPSSVEPVRFYWPDGRSVYRVATLPLPARGMLAHFVPTYYPQQITTKEMLTLTWLIAGWPDQEIANMLHISERTVHSHVSSLFRKMGVAKRSQAAVKAAINHWYIPDPDGILFTSLYGSQANDRPEPSRSGRLRP